MEKKDANMEQELADAKQKIEGFRGIIFGEEFSKKSKEFYFMFSPKGYANSKVYTRINDERLMGEAEIDRIEYEYVDNKFYAAYAYISTSDDFGKLKISTFEKFGPPHYKEDYKNLYVWDKFEGVDIRIAYISEKDLGLFVIKSTNIERLLDKSPVPTNGF